MFIFTCKGFLVSFLSIYDKCYRPIKHVREDLFSLGFSQNFVFSIRVTPYFVERVSFWLRALWTLVHYICQKNIGASLNPVERWSVLLKGGRPHCLVIDAPTPSRPKWLNIVAISNPKSDCVSFRLKPVNVVMRTVWKFAYGLPCSMLAIQVVELHWSCPVGYQQVAVVSFLRSSQVPFPKCRRVRESFCSTAVLQEEGKKI